jgi:hypothetical protein
VHDTGDRHPKDVRDHKRHGDISHQTVQFPDRAFSFPTSDAGPDPGRRHVLRAELGVEFGARWRVSPALHAWNALRFDSVCF